MTRVFISHSSKDQSLVERIIIEPLQQHGLDIWYSKDAIATSQQWERSIVRGLETSDWITVVMTPNATESEWVKDEVHWAIENKPDRIVPILLEDCDPTKLHIRMGRIQFQDFRNQHDLRPLLAQFGEPNSGPAGLALLVVEGPSVGDIHPLRIGDTRIGRSRESVIQLRDDYVSRQHCTIQVSPQGSVRLIQQSRNRPTLVGEQSVDDVYPVALEDRISIGKSNLRLVIWDDNVTQDDEDEYGTFDPDECLNEINAEDFASLISRFLTEARPKEILEIGRRIRAKRASSSTPWDPYESWEDP